VNRTVVLALLAACAGVVDVWAVVALGGAFAGVVTGNLVTAGHALAVAEPARLLPPAVAVAGFVVGVALWSLLRRRWPTAVSVPLVAELVVLVVLAVAWPLAPGATLPLLAGAALAMGGQSSVAQLLGQSTTYMTGTLTGAVSDLATGDGRRWPALRQLGAIVLGAVAGGLALAYLPAVVPALAHLPVVVPALAALLAAAAAAVVVRAVGDRRVQDDPVGPSAPQDDDVEGAPTVPLHPQVEALLNLMAEQGGAPPETMTVAQNRAMIREMAAVSGPPEPVAAVRDDRAGDVPVRIYTPEGAGPFPTVVLLPRRRLGRRRPRHPRGDGPRDLRRRRRGRRRGRLPAGARGPVPGGRRGRDRRGPRRPVPPRRVRRQRGARRGRRLRGRQPVRGRGPARPDHGVAAVPAAGLPGRRRSVTRALDAPRTPPGPSSTSPDDGLVRGPLRSPASRTP
jgi:uncharacterized membrane protein YoaK (UPF0700 family)